MEAYHSFLIGGPISIVCIDGGSESFFRPTIFDNEVMVDKTTSGPRVNEGLGVGNLTK